MSSILQKYTINSKNIFQRTDIQVFQLVAEITQMNYLTRKIIPTQSLPTAYN